MPRREPRNPVVVLGPALAARSDDDVPAWLDEELELHAPIRVQRERLRLAPEVEAILREKLG